MNKKKEMIKLSMINWGTSGSGLLKGFLGTLNTRDSNTNYDFENDASDVALYTSIAAIGVSAPPIMYRDGESVIALQGTRRWNALKAMSELDPERFKELGYGKGLECVVVSDASQEELMLIVADHHTVKKLSPVEQYYTVSRFAAFGWDVDKISKQTGIKKAMVTTYSRIAAIGKIEHSGAIEIYEQAIRALRGRSGYEEEATMPQAQILLGIMSAAKAAASAEEGGDLSEAEVLDRSVSGLKATKDKTIDEMVKLSKEPLAVVAGMKSIKEVRDKYEKSTGADRVTLAWVLNITA